MNIYRWFKDYERLLKPHCFTAATPNRLEKFQHIFSALYVAALQNKSISFYNWTISQTEKGYVSNPRSFGHWIIYKQ